MFLDRIYDAFTHDIAIDLGTANTLVYKKGHGIVLDEPSIVAVTNNNTELICIGKEAKNMVGKNPKEVNIIHPLKDGVIADFKITELMLHHLMKKAMKKKFLIKPRVIVCVPSGITEVEKRAVRDSALQAGARSVFLVSEPVAAAIGAGLPIHKPQGNLIMDVGGGTSEIAVISLSHIVTHNSIRLGGDKLDQNIIDYLRLKKEILVGHQTAEEIKKKIGSACPLADELKMQIRGRDIITGYPITKEISSEEIREALSENIDKMINAIKRLFEKTAPELAADIAETGMILTGGGGLLKGLAEKISEVIHLPVLIAEEPLTSVVKGSGKILDNLETYKEVLMEEIIN